MSVTPKAQLIPILKGFANFNEWSNSLIEQEKRDKDDIAKGIVKFLVDVYDEEGDTVMLATILTMVKKIDQS